MLSGAEHSSDADDDDEEEDLHEEGALVSSKRRPPAAPPPDAAELPAAAAERSSSTTARGIDEALLPQTSSWLSEANASLARAPPRPAPPHNHIFVAFCFGFSLVGSVFLLFLALLMFSRYQYLEVLRVGPSSSADAVMSHERAVVATFGAASIYAALAMICAVYLFIRCVLEGRRSRKSK